MRILLSLLVAMLMLTGCCVTSLTSVRNETHKDLSLSVVRQSEQVETVMIRASSTGRCGGLMLNVPDQPAVSWIISDGQSRFIYADVSPIATMPGPFVSSSRFTSDFPCN